MTPEELAAQNGETVPPVQSPDDVKPVPDLDAEPDAQDVDPAEVIKEVNALRSDFNTLQADVKQFISDARGGKLFAAYEDFQAFKRDTTQGTADVKATVDSVKETAAGNTDSITALRTDFTQLGNDVNSFINDVKRGKIFSLVGDATRVGSDLRTGEVDASEVEARLLGR